jgi:hypothetical protein
VKGECRLFRLSPSQLTKRTNFYNLSIQL